MCSGLIWCYVVCGGVVWFGVVCLIWYGLVWFGVVVVWFDIKGLWRGV